MTARAGVWIRRATVAAAAALALPALALTGDETRGDGVRRDIGLRVIHAAPTDDGHQVDPRLRSIADRLIARFPGKRFRLLKDVTQPLAVNETAEVLLPDEHRVEVTPVRFEGRTIRMQIRLVPPAGETVEMAADAAGEGTIVIGGLRHADGTLLVLVRGH